jgi:DnaJ-domain-containing protein 1
MSWSLRDSIRQEWLARHPGHKGKLPTLKARVRDNIQADKEQRERENREMRERLERIEQDRVRIEQEGARLEQEWRGLLHRLEVAPYASSLEVLGLTPPVTRNEIQTAYRDLAKLHHPDRGGDAKQFAKATDAYKFAMRREER